MPFAQINATPLNGKTTVYKREGAYYKTVGGALPATRITSQIEIDAIEANRNKTEFYQISVLQLAEILGQDPSVVKYPPIGEAANINFDNTSAENGVTLAIDGKPNVGSIVVRIGIVGKAGADMHIGATGAFDLGKTIAGHTLKAGDILSVTFAYFEGSYTTVDEALTSLEAWEWAKPYASYKIPVIEVTGGTFDPNVVAVGVGEKVLLNLETEPADNGQPIRFFSQDDDIASVDSNGIVTGIKAGSTKIFARFNNDKLALYVDVDVSATSNP